jgi:hypothetical protein
MNENEPIKLSSGLIVYKMRRKGRTVIKTMNKHEAYQYNVWYSKLKELLSSLNIFTNGKN